MNLCTSSLVQMNTKEPGSLILAPFKTKKHLNIGQVEEDQILKEIKEVCKNCKV